MTNQSLFLLDVDSRRRAAIAHTLSTSGIHVEPFESISELIDHGPRSSEIIVACDEDDIVSDLVHKLAERSSWSPIVAYREAPEVRRIVHAVQTGVDDYLAWPFSVSDLSRAVDRAIANGNSLRGSRSREIAARARVERLTNRERQVLVGLADGLTNRGIAEHLQISPRTVEIHRSNLLNKIHARHTSDAIRVAIEANLPDQP